MSVRGRETAHYCIDPRLLGTARGKKSRETNQQMQGLLEGGEIQTTWEDFLQGDLRLVARMTILERTA